MRIDSAVAIVTGASSGIGKDLAIRLAERGAKTVLVARRGALLDEVRATCERHAPSLAAVCDVRERAQVESMVTRARGHFGRVDLLVNNAGYSRWTLARDAAVEDYEELMRTNYFGTVYATKAVLPLLLAQRAGHIVNIGSIAGKLGVANHTHYCASKFAVAGFTESLWFELRDTGVGVTLVNPGVIDTALFDHESFRAFPAHNRARMIPVRPLTDAIISAIEKGRFEVTMPGYMAFGPAVRHLWPSLFRALASRFG